MCFFFGGGKLMQDGSNLSPHPKKKKVYVAVSPNCSGRGGKFTVLQLSSNEKDSFFFCMQKLLAQF
jgi:hypothetical protein